MMKVHARVAKTAVDYYYKQRELLYLSRCMLFIYTRRMFLVFYLKKDVGLKNCYIFKNKISKI